MDAGRIEGFVHGGFAMLRVPSPLAGIVRLSVIAVVLGSAAACAATEAAPPPRAESVTIEGASMAYSAFVAPLNARLEAIGRRVDAARTVDEMRQISGDFARLHDEYAAGLRALVVPPTVRATLLDAAVAAEQVAVAERRAAQAAPAEFRAVGSDLAEALDEQRRRINLLREALGLAPVE